jgi:hypothetical protein
VAPAEVAGSTSFGTCLEARLGPEVAGSLVSGQREETAAEETVLEECLAATAAGVVPEAISPAVAACVESRLDAGVLQAVGSGARELTAQEETALADCLLASTLGAAFGGATSAVTACLGERFGAEAAQLILSGSREATEEEETALADCLLVSAQATLLGPVAAGVSECLEQRVGAEAAQAIASGSRKLTADEQAALGDCVLASAFGATTVTAFPAVDACLEGKLGTEAAQAIASGSRQLTADEQTVLGDCVLASAFTATTGAVSPAVAACLKKRLGAEAAQAAASGSRELNAQESSVLGSCLLEAALGGKP